MNYQSTVETTNDQPELRLEQTEAVKARVWRVRLRCKEPDGFDYFIKHVFSASFKLGEFVYGDYIHEVAQKMMDYDWTIDVSARDHFKSTRIYAEVMYDIFTSETDIEAHYFSFMSSMSSYHIAKIKKMIAVNPFFIDVVDRSFNSIASIKVHNAYGAFYSCVPQGLLTFKRGIHAERVYLDDPLKDPENKLVPTAIYKVNQVVKTEIFPMVKKGGKCRIVGTPQTNSDFFFDKKLGEWFKVDIRPAIVDELKGIAVFPEWKSFEELLRIRETIGEKSFNQEYMTKPAYQEESYIDRNDLLACIDPDMQELKSYTGTADIVAGFDIGKKAHPSHMSVFKRTTQPDGSYKYRQIFQQFLDGMEYKDQLEFIEMIVERFRIDILRYDNTRSEFEAFAEQGLLPDCMEPVVFTMKMNSLMAVGMNKVIQEKRVTLLNDNRQTDQILQVNNDLKAIESPMGHGDSFWSNAMALLETPAKEYQVRSL